MSGRVAWCASMQPTGCSSSSVRPTRGGCRVQVRVLSNCMAKPAHFPVHVTPRFEVFYALQILESGAAERFAPWRREIERRLPARARTEIARVGPCPLMWPLLADALREEPPGISFAEMISALGVMDDSS